MPGAVTSAMDQKLPALRAGRFWPMPPRRPLVGGKGSAGRFTGVQAPAAGSYALGAIAGIRPATDQFIKVIVILIQDISDVNHVRYSRASAVELYLDG